MVQKSLYFNVPDRQRGNDIWPYWQQQLFIDTLLRGPEFFTLLPIVLNKEYEDMDDGKRRLYYSAEDGLQRLTAIYAFIDGKIRTFSETEYEKYVLVDELNNVVPFKVTFGELDDERKQEFLAYPLPVMVTEQADPVIAGERFRRRNLGIKISAGEDLQSFHPTGATVLAKKIGSHAIWSDMFTSKKRRDRKYHFEMALYIIHMALHGFPIQLQRTTLKRLAAGKDDVLITPELEAEILQDLDNIGRICLGVHITAKTDAIPLFQMLTILKKASCNFERSKPGCMSAWFSDAKVMRLHDYSYGNLSLFAGMTHKDLQQSFWDSQKSVILDQDGLVFDDMSQRRKVRDSIFAFDEPPSVYALIHENGTVAVPSDYTTFA
jgi:hypothetical protein